MIAIQLTLPHSSYHLKSFVVGNTIRFQTINSQQQQQIPRSDLFAFVSPATRVLPPRSGAIKVDQLASAVVSRRNGSEPWYKHLQRRQSLESSNQSQASNHAYHGTCSSANNSFPYFVALPTPGNNAIPFPPSSSGGYDDFDGFLFGEPKTSMDLDLLNSHEDRNSYPQLTSLWSPSEETSAVPLPALPEAGTPRNHDCEALAIETIRSLHYSPDYFTYLPPALAPSDEAGAAHDVAMPSVDKIILLNRKALAKLPELLECPCARYPHLALLHITILCKALFLYRVAVCAHDMRSSSPGSDDQSPCGSGIGSSSSGSMNQMQPAKIQIGELQLDADDQATLHSAILLRELRKTESTIRKLRVLDMGWANEDWDILGELSATYWYRISMPKICEELDRLIKMATKNRDKVS
ncbi:hypothetical protein BDU57DRAFT_569979 [Ampelomyces quisqualis]|uniref:Aflatoxin regulatory protein domain-containing protein n=1 Tax=Ampelomyces quisqualis TaxID=50730 RepID=A0A6A5QVP8_AMPQU|nr:hypothetical protein BDU57DRAFT_569979 [Ampelomyces quisqualis]